MTETQTLVEKLRELDFVFENNHTPFEAQQEEYRGLINQYAEQNELVAQAITKGPKRVKFHKVVSRIADQSSKEQVEAMGLEVIFNDAIQKLGFEKDYSPWIGAAIGAGVFLALGTPLVVVTAPFGGLVGYKIVKERKNQREKRLQNAKESLKADALYLDSKIRQVYNV